MTIDTTPEINFLPVCSVCHGILYDQTISYEIRQPNELTKDIFCDITSKICENKWLNPSFHIEPETCPYCRSVFKSISIPTKLPFTCEKPEPSLKNEADYLDWFFYRDLGGADKIAVRCWDKIRKFILFITDSR